MDSFSAPPSRSSSQISPQDLKEQLKSQLAMEYAQQFLETVRGKCFEKCITRPSSSLSGSESSCISRIREDILSTGEALERSRKLVAYM